MTARPVLALVAPPGTSERAVPLLRLLGLGADVVSWHAHRTARRPGPDAFLVTTVGALAGLPELPTAVWAADAEELRIAQAAGVVAVLTDRLDLVELGAVLVPPFGIDLRRWPPLAPLVRARWRERYDLPPELVVGVDAPLDPDHSDLPLAVGSVVVVTGPLTTRALALAAPTVTNAATARRLGLRPGLDVEVARTPSDAAGLARTIAGDAPRASALSRRGRRFAERHLDLGAAADTVGASLALAPAIRIDPAERITARLTELSTPSPSWVRDRAAAALEPFTLAGAPR